MMLDMSLRSYWHGDVSIYLTDVQLMCTELLAWLASFRFTFLVSCFLPTIFTQAVTLLIIAIL